MLLEFVKGLKLWIVWSWSYLWAFWFILVVFIIYYLRGPLRLKQNITMGMYTLEVIICSLNCSEHNLG